MTHDMLRTVLDTANAKETDGWQVPADGRLLSLYAGHDGVPLTVQKIDAVKLAHGVLHARSAKGDLYMIALEDVFAVGFDAGAATKATRTAGFLAG